MNREALEAYLTGTYAVVPDRPWARHPDDVVFRHTGNRKWFTLVMRIPGSRLGLPGDGLLDVVNVRCDLAVRLSGGSRRRNDKGADKHEL